MSKNVAMLNQGDFFQAFDSLLEQKPLDVVPYQAFGPAAFIWSYSISNGKPWTERNTNWLYIWAHTRLQRLFSIHFDLFLMALISKLIVLVCCYRLAILCPAHVGLPEAFVFPLFVLFLLVFAYAHNVGFLNSFYGEHTFLVFLPMALLGILERRRWLRMILLSLGLFFASGAKPQYFYLPLMTIFLMSIFSIVRRRRPDVPMMASLLVVFAVSWFYAFHAEGDVANYYNSTYFGSYLLLADEQLQKLGVRSADLECVGVDPWGNKVDRRDTLKLSLGPTNCAERSAIDLRTVVRPYIANPRLLFDLWRWLAPVHFTVRYFHVYPGTRYLIPSDGKSFHSGNTLLRLSALRERFVTPYYAVIVLIGLLLPLVSYRSVVSSEMKMVTLLLALFVGSQFAVCLLGEGARDLSKHLAGAQFCLDLLCVFIVLQAAVLGYRFKTGSA